MLSKTALICWIFMVFAVVFEVAGSGMMKYSSGKDWELLGLLIMYILLFFSYFFMAKAVTGIPIGAAYAFWEAMGLALISVISVLFLDETMTVKRAIALSMALCGTLLVNIGTSHGSEGSK